MRCLNDGDKTGDWGDLIQVFELNEWEIGDFGKIKLRANWRDSFIKPLEWNDHRGSQCSRQCQGTETVYYCFDCTKNPLYEICEECFDEEQHVGHRYTSRVVTRSEGKVCHCGDVSGYNRPEKAFQCKISRNNERENAEKKELYSESWIETISSIFDYLIDFCFCSNNEDERGETIQMCDSGGNFEVFPNKYALILYERECNIHIQDVVRKISQILKKDISYGTFILSDFDQDEHFTVVVESRDREPMIALKEIFAKNDIPLHLVNIATVFKKQLISELMRFLHHFGTNHPMVLKRKLTLRIALMDTYRQRLFHKGNFKINILGKFTVPNERLDNFPWIEPWAFHNNGDEQHDERILKIMRNYDSHIRETDISNTSNRYTEFNGSRFQYLITEFLETFSHTTRIRLLEILCAVFSVTDDTKRCLAAQYLDVYCNVLYHTIVSDTTGFKLTLMSTLSQYIFPSPEIANMIVKSGFIERCLYFSYSVMGCDPETIRKSGKYPIAAEFKLPESVIKNKKAVICFKDIYQAMCTNTDPSAVFKNLNLVNAMTECFLSFTDILPLKRETSEHVTYENFDFSSFYFFFSSILIMVDGFLRNISLILDPEERKVLVSSLLRRSIDTELAWLNESRFKASMNMANGSSISNIFQGSVYNVQAPVFNFKVGSDIQSFFNPISYYIKFILQWSQCGRYEPLPTQSKDCFKLSEFFNSKFEALWIAEPALSTLVMISQVEIGFWVRNGSPIQHQLKMYTRYSMREFTYFSDFYNVQFSMCFADPNEFMVTYIIRWGLKNWAEGIPIGDYPEEESTLAMVEQCLLTLIRLLTEIRSLSVLSSVEGFERTMKYEIIHSLFFKSCSYSNLVDAIPEHVTKHPAFDLYLREYSDFHEPSGLFDNGTYTLKKQYRKEIDPYFIGFSSNKRYEARQLIRDTMKESKGIAFNDTFVPAINVHDKLKQSQYPALYQITSTNIFGNFIKNTLVQCVKMELDSMLEKILHLIHLCMVNNLSGFEKIFWREYHLEESSSDFYHSIGSILYMIFSSDQFSSENGKIKEIFRFLKDTAPHVNIDDYLSEQTPNYDFRLLFDGVHSSGNEEFNKKKILAKLRREKMMQKLAKQQKQFMTNHNVSTDELCSRDTSVENSDVDISWNYPEDDCVFCKMPKDYDVLIYFVFVERNIVSSSISCDGLEKSVNFEPVLTTCGHCAHFGCLLSHMKSIRKSLGQITKNVQDNFGLSSFNCSLCNSIVNAFIPIMKGVQNCTDYNSTSLGTRHSLSLLCELTNAHSSAKDGFPSLVKLLANTINNLELTMRDKKSKFIVKKLSARQITSLRLLDDLISFGLEKGILSIDTTGFEDPFAQFCCSMFSNEKTKTIYEILREKAIYELFICVERLVLCLLNKSVPKVKIDMEVPIPSSDILSQILISRIRANCKTPLFDVVNIEIYFKSNKHQVLEILMNEFLIFLRKACVALHLRFISEEPITLEERKGDLFEYMLDYCKLPSFVELLQNLFSNTDGMSSHSLELDISSLPKFSVWSPFIDLAGTMKQMSNALDPKNGLRIRALKDDVAICLFCKSTCYVQKSALLHFSRIGECTNHYYNDCKFKSPYGCFILLKSNIIYLSYGARGTFYQTPYVNKHGETDEDYKLGTPVFFNEARYEHFIREVVMSGKIPHLINRANEKTTDLGGWESM